MVMELSFEPFGEATIHVISIVFPIRSNRLSCREGSAITGAV